jgi:hypothetical protein
MVNEALRTGPRVASLDRPCYEEAQVKAPGRKRPYFPEAQTDGEDETADGKNIRYRPRE